jgi:hypothetical protein
MATPWQTMSVPTSHEPECITIPDPEFHPFSMRSPLRWFRRRSEFNLQSARRLELESEFSRFRGNEILLIPASAKGGYDQIYYAMENGRHIAVVRVNSPHKKQTDPVLPDDPAVPLDAQQRLEREWDAYSRLFPLGLSPEPIWRTKDAIACSWVRWRRASRMLVKRREMAWPILERAMDSIDFEFGAVSWIDERQQMAYDYLLLLNDIVKPRRGGKVILADLPRLKELLETTVPPQVRAAELGFCLKRLSRMAAEPALREMLEQVFPRLNDGSSLPAHPAEDGSGR